MQKHTVYRIISFILLPIAGLLAVMAMMALITALANPPMLLPVFMLACVVIYVFTSFRFFNKGVLQQTYSKPSLKDWIKVNAIVTGIFAIMSLIQVIAVAANPAILSQLVDQTLTMQGNPSNISKETLLGLMKGVLYFLGIFATLLLVHIVLTFRLLKKYSWLFGSPENPE